MNDTQLDQLVQRLIDESGLNRKTNMPAREYVPTLRTLVAGISYRLGNATILQRAA